MTFRGQGISWKVKSMEKANIQAMIEWWGFTTALIAARILSFTKEEKRKKNKC